MKTRTVALASPQALTALLQRLQAKLHLVRVPKLVALLAGLGRSGFVIHRADLQRIEQVVPRGAHFHQIHLRRHAQALRSHLD